MELVLIWVGLAVVTAIVAGSKGRSSFGWFLLAMLVSGVLALILIALLPSLKPTVVHVASGAPALPADDSKTCPRCAETVRKAALVCRYCKYEFTAEEVKSAAEKPLFDKNVFVRRYKPAMSARYIYETNINGSKRRFDTEEEATQLIWRYRNQRAAADVFPTEGAGSSLPRDRPFN